MKKCTSNDGTFWVSQIKTKEGINVAFCYAWEDALPETAEDILEEFPQFFVLENEADLWLKSEADSEISLEDLKKAVAFDQVDAVVLYNLDDKSVILGPEDWFDIDSLEEC